MKTALTFCRIVLLGIMLCASPLPAFAQGEKENGLPPVLKDAVARFDQAYAKLPSREKSYIDVVLEEGARLNDTLHAVLVKTMEWDVCVNNGLTTKKHADYFSAYTDRETRRYRAAYTEYEATVLNNVRVIDRDLLSAKIRGQGLLSAQVLKEMFREKQAKTPAAEIPANCAGLRVYFEDQMSLPPL